MENKMEMEMKRPDGGARGKVKGSPKIGFFHLGVLIVHNKFYGNPAITLRYTVSCSHVCSDPISNIHSHAI